ncbi:hypothetical protein [Streptomyces collinus]|uniref:hypothetical protein n=1 Tax=Streptomyces collinus TaxID=42684 RepID=UPI00368B9FD9
MLRRPITRWALLAAVLVVIGLCPATAAPIAWASAGAATALAAVPGKVLLGLAVIAYLRNRPATAPKASA